MKIKNLIVFIALFSVVQATVSYPTCTSTTDVGQLQCWFASFGIDIIGGGVLLGTVIVILFCIWLTVGGYSFETTLLALWTLGFLLSDSALVPPFFKIVMIILGAIPIFLAGVKVAGNIGL
jgi:hypothetical protein